MLQWDLGSGLDTDRRVLVVGLFGDDTHQVEPRAGRSLPRGNCPSFGTRIWYLVFVCGLSDSFS